MKERILAGLFLFLATITLAQPKSSYLLQPDRVFDGIEMHEGWGVWIEGDKIAGVGPKESLKPSSGTKTISMPGATLLPGLIEGHSHLLLYPSR